MSELFKVSFSDILEHFPFEETTLMIVGYGTNSDVIHISALWYFCRYLRVFLNLFQDVPDINFKLCTEDFMKRENIKKLKRNFKYAELDSIIAKGPEDDFFFELLTAFDNRDAQYIVNFTERPVNPGEQAWWDDDSDNNMLEQLKRITKFDKFFIVTPENDEGTLVLASENGSTPFFNAEDGNHIESTPLDPDSYIDIIRRWECRTMIEINSSVFKELRINNPFSDKFLRLFHQYLHSNLDILPLQIYDPVLFTIEVITSHSGSYDFYQFLNDKNDLDEDKLLFSIQRMCNDYVLEKIGATGNFNPLCLTSQKVFEIQDIYNRLGKIEEQIKSISFGSTSSQNEYINALKKTLETTLSVNLKTMQDSSVHVPQETYDSDPIQIIEQVQQLTMHSSSNVPNLFSGNFDFFD
nr:MAG: matrix protein [Tolviot virus]